MRNVTWWDKSPSLRTHLDAILIQFRAGTPTSDRPACVLREISQTSQLLFRELAELRLNLGDLDQPAPGCVIQPGHELD